MEEHINVNVDAVRKIYDKAYASPGIMGTHLDKEYSRVTKTTLLSMCQNAPNHRLLDVGTGDGDLWEFADPGMQWHGVDPSIVGITRAKKRFSQLNAIVAIAENLPYPSDFFGAVIAADTIEHVFDLEGSLQEIWRVMTPGGSFVLSVPTPDSLRKWGYNRFLKQRPSLKMFGRLIWVLLKRTILFGNATFQPIDRDLSLQEWKDLLINTGFDVITIVEWPTEPLMPIVYLIHTQKTS